MTTTADPLGQHAYAFRRMLRAVRDLTPRQLAALDETNCQAFGLTADEAAILTAANGGVEPEAAHLRALDALHASGRFSPAQEAGLKPGPAWQPLLAVLLQDLLDPEDYAEMTGPWFATFGKPAIDST